MRSTTTRPSRWPVAVLCCGLGLAVGGCREALCFTPFQADVRVWLADDWPDRAQLLITLSCPEGEECGFLQGPVAGQAGETVTASTYLRPPELEVSVTRQSTGEVVHAGQLDVTYDPVGTQSECGGEAQAEIMLPGPGGATS